MKRQKIDTIEKLEKFVSDESVSIEARFEVFTNALSDYSVSIMQLKYNEACNKIDDPNNKIVAEMKRLINEIKTTPTQPHFAGFTVQYFKY